jgi:hypothetical protein
VLVGHTHEEMVAAAAAAVAVAAPPAPHGRAARGARSNSARAAGDGVSEGVTKRCGRGGRGGRGAAAAAAAQVAAAAARAAAAAAAAAAKEQQARQEQQQQAQQVQQPAASGSASGSGQLPANLRVEPGRALKHSGSSEGPLSPTSPSGGSPRVNRCVWATRMLRLGQRCLRIGWQALHLMLLAMLGSCQGQVQTVCHKAYWSHSYMH